MWTLDEELVRDAELQVPGRNAWSGSEGRVLRWIDSTSRDRSSCKLSCHAYTLLL